MSIRVLKLSTGEEIISDIEGITKVGEKELLPEDIILSRPCSIHLVPTEQGFGVELLPWAIYAKDHKAIPLKNKNILFCIEPMASIRNQYAEIIGLPTIPDNSIISPNSGSIIT